MAVYTVAGTVVGLTFVIGTIFMFAFIFEDPLVDYHPIANYRNKKTPPCSKCIHYCGEMNYSKRIQCRCPQAIESYEKEYLQIVGCVDASKVRGTRNCKFKSADESKPEEESNVKKDEKKWSFTKSSR